MKKIFSLIAMALVSVAMWAGSNDLLWDYSENKIPTSGPDRGLYYGSYVNDAPSTNLGLNGVKMNSSGYAYFTKAAVAGKLKLTFGPRKSGAKVALLVHTWSGETPSAETKIAETSVVDELQTAVIDLTAEQNNIYITRTSTSGEGVLQKIQFREGTDDTPEECDIIFKDQNGKELGRVKTYEGAALEAIPYTEADLPSFPDAMAFRGWFYVSNVKAKIGDIISGNTTIQAKVTPIEYATLGSVWTYDFTSPTFYIEDHDLISREGNEITLKLAGEGAKAIVAVTDNGTRTKKEYDGDATAKLTVSDKIQKIVVYIVKDFLAKDEKTGYYVVPASDVACFLLALEDAQSGDKIFLPNGVYDLGTTCLTAISKNNIAIVGQSMEGTVIKNAPDAKDESIDKTATIKINKNVSGTYLQDLTIQNALDYYKNDNGRAVALWDQGTKTVCKNVRLLSYQDTYYSNLQGAVKYFEDCEIHGTVDFICGDGSVYFKNNLLYCEKRKKNGGGSDALTANNGIASDRGYVFEGCTVKSECPTVSFGRAWNNTPTTTFLNTLVDYSAGEFSFESSDGKIQRWTKELMNANAWPKFGEFNTHLANGTVLTPANNVVTFLDTKSGNATQDIETVLTAEQAAAFTMDYTLGDWSATAANDAKQTVCEATADQFEPNGLYLVEGDGEFKAIILGSEFMDRFAVYDGVNYTARKANARGGFGKPADNITAIDNVPVSNSYTVKIIRNGQVVILRDNKEYSVLGTEIRH